MKPFEVLTLYDLIELINGGFESGGAESVTISDQNPHDRLLL